MMMDWYYEQIEQSKPMTWDVLCNLNNKKYDSGRDIQVGDVVLFGYLKTGETNSTLIKFHKDELNTLYEVIDENQIAPTLRLISTG